MDVYLATILLWPVNFAPNGWAFCAGQLLSIAQNTALFALLGTTYGGDGISNFALPDFRGRIPVGAGANPVGSTYQLGEKGGVESVTLIVSQMPSHTHTANLSVTLTMSASNAQATDSVPTSTINTLAAPYDVSNLNPIAGYNKSAPNTPLNIGSGNGTVTGQLGLTGGSLPHENRQPYSVVNYIIALVGIFPPRS